MFVLYSYWYHQPGATSSALTRNKDLDRDQTSTHRHFHDAQSVEPKLKMREFVQCPSLHSDFLIIKTDM